MKVPIEISARHIHLSQKDLECLFGKGYQLKKLRGLTQPKDFCACETLTIKAGEKKIENVRIVGPIREETQVELSLTDAINLNINPPILLSGKLEKSLGGIFLVGPKGEIKLERGVIIPQRHIHCSPQEAKKLGLRNNQKVSLEIKGKRSLIFNNVVIRVGKDFKLCCHLDTDEGNAAGIVKKGEGKIIKI